MDRSLHPPFVVRQTLAVARNVFSSTLPPHEHPLDVRKDPAALTAGASRLPRRAYSAPAANSVAAAPAGRQAAALRAPRDAARRLLLPVPIYSLVLAAGAPPPPRAVAWRGTKPPRRARRRRRDHLFVEARWWMRKTTSQLIHAAPSCTAPQLPARTQQIMAVVDVFQGSFLF
ncbi:hypothetical protein BRADI_3g15765v3 [Brachypodium distachyon]|uniref:Uncharacterized protein n=1 Tax=Brachypodium distachyon TaxID=15368 RepID=A0A2K2CXD5_BRADI|nr:hypothetical protein BRADI_3g15765v3 [Brachypodium distachyon]